MIRGLIYLLVAGVAWVTEGIVFSNFLSFGVAQTAAIVVLYIALFACAAVWFVRLADRHEHQPGGLPLWRYVSLAPQIALVVGSFISLPIVIAVLALGKLG